jgi:hypothetical protein
MDDKAIFKPEGLKIGDFVNQGFLPADQYLWLEHSDDIFGVYVCERWYLSGKGVNQTELYFFRKYTNRIESLRIHFPVGMILVVGET